MCALSKTGVFIGLLRCRAVESPVPLSRSKKGGQLAVNWRSMWIVPEAELSKQPAQLRERADEDRAAWATPHTDRHAAVDGRQPVEVGEEGGRVGIPYIRAITFAWLAALRKAHSAGERDERANAPARCPPSLSDRAAAGSAPVHRRKPWLPGRRQARGRAVRRRSPLRTRHDRARRAARQHVDGVELSGGKRERIRRH